MMLRFFSASLFLSFCVLFVTRGELRAQESHDFSKGPYTYSDELPTGKRKGKAKKKKDYKGFNKLKPEFKLLCQFVHEDGRGDKLFKILDKNKGTKSGCLYCKSFFKAFWGGCRSAGFGLQKKIKEILKRREQAEEAAKKEELIAAAGEGGDLVGDDNENKGEEVKDETSEDENTVENFTFPPSREPRLKTIDQASRLFITLAREDVEHLTEIIKAVSILIEQLEDGKDKTLAEREYFAILSAYISYPFKHFIEYERKRAIELEKERKERERREQFLLDDY